MAINKSWFRGRLKEIGLNQSIVAARLGIDRSAMSRVLSGERKLSLQECKMISIIIDRPIDEVITNIGERETLKSEGAMTGNIEEAIYEKAKTDGQFAIAFAILELVKSHEKLRGDLCFGQFPKSKPGVLENLNILASDLLKHLDSRP
ncbi:helix-turn-helix domain-containing protein [Aurantimonas coralicida]|uniref:helix-turn-helix domain-containing protein n=1 Tax=Aurantimonas coralicida TaxID=182270 RepID=UPI001E2A9320|nr:helix-turn-helix transcriptional regulator [Aurantimonas coralicida]MCD1642471.1 helix-turn-helix domain-containing protein [Aurantimonas coralicida]